MITPAKLEEVSDLDSIAMGDPVPVTLQVGSNGHITTFSGLAAYIHEGDHPILLAQSDENAVLYTLGLYGKDRIKIENGRLTEDVKGLLVPKTISRTITLDSPNYSFYREHLKKIGLWN